MSQEGRKWVWIPIQVTSQFGASFSLLVQWKVSSSFFFFFFFNSSIADLQCCVSFWCTVKWFSYRNINAYIYVCVCVYTWYLALIFHAAMKSPCGLWVSDVSNPREGRAMDNQTMTTTQKWDLPCVIHIKWLAMYHVEEKQYIRLAYWMNIYTCISLSIRLYICIYVHSSWGGKYKISTVM